MTADGRAPARPRDSLARMPVRDLIKRDFERARAAHGHEVWLHKGLWALIDYRIGHWARTDAPRPLRFVLMAVTMLTRKLLVEPVTGISIEPHARIGHSFYIAHFGGIVLHEKVVIGDECQIAQGVTIGTDAHGGVPQIGNRVVVWPHAMVFGGIQIGDDATIGAGALVFHDVPAGGTAVGVPPSRIIPARDDRS